MPSKSPAQKQLMDAVAHGWKPAHPRKTLPTVGVARDFVQADRQGESPLIKRPAFMKPRFDR